MRGEGQGYESACKLAVTKLLNLLGFTVRNMVESAAVRDISVAPASSALNAIKTPLILTAFLQNMVSLNCTSKSYTASSVQSTHMVCFYAVSLTYEAPNVSCPCPLSAGPSQWCSSPVYPIGSDKEGQPRCRCCGRRERRCKSLNYLSFYLFAMQFTRPVCHSHFHNV